MCKNKEAVKYLYSENFCDRFPKIIITGAGYCLIQIQTRINFNFNFKKDQIY